MTETLTFSKLEEIWNCLIEINKKYPRADADFILLTKSELRAINEKLNLKIVQSSVCGGNKMMGIPVETFETKQEVLKRSAELIGEGKKVIILK